ncbi:N-acetyltransferase GCN5 [Fictibacillus macauensis ZFHKF-1]|uniref:N-acetyltransferase GCN5 n=1 Tax=Fictibacillus macauensis ZFHKF-1 TaxID=1196324 RepID=I8AN00_9BACL|nr:GNAT family N-acetyltransferase [Fictibacillus macauensis]EIT87387.1 N-acetyltransferase GCN5 [Fictibacillus macauensis ZFHKF-1]
MKELLTHRLRLRQWELGDAPALYDYAKRAEVGPRAGWAPHQSLQESEEVVALFIAEQDCYAIEHLESGIVIGSIGLHLRKPDETITHDRQREIGYVLHPDYWGQGYVPEAVKEVIRYSFQELFLETIWCGHFDFNDQSRRVNEKCHFHYQFSKQEQLKRLNNQEVTVLYYTIQRNQYKYVNKQDQER